MGRYNDDDKGVSIEARIEHTTAKAYLAEPTHMGGKTFWIPKSQIIEMSDPDDEGRVDMVISSWIARQNGITET